MVSVGWFASSFNEIKEELDDNFLNTIYITNKAFEIAGNMRKLRNRNAAKNHNEYNFQTVAYY